MPAYDKVLKQFNISENITIQSAQVSREREQERGGGVSKRAGAEEQSKRFISAATSVISLGEEPISVYLLVHDAGQLPGQVPVVGLHLIMVLLLVLLYQTLVHCQCLATGVHKLPADSKYTHQEAGRV